MRMVHASALKMTSVYIYPSYLSSQLAFLRVSRYCRDVQRQDRIVDGQERETCIVIWANYVESIFDGHWLHSVYVIVEYIKYSSIYILYTLYIALAGTYHMVVQVSGVLLPKVSKLNLKYKYVLCLAVYTLNTSNSRIINNCENCRMQQLPRPVEVVPVPTYAQIVLLELHICIITLQRGSSR